MRITRNVRKLEGYVPGEQPKARRVVKLNTNENPYPPSPACGEILKNFDLEALRRYPDPVFGALRTELARLNGTTPDRIFVGNGSDEILSLVLRAFVEDDESVASLDPSYSLYRTLAGIRGVPWHGVSAADMVRGKPLRPHAAPVSLFLWTNPNAPTGEFVAPEVLARFARTFPGVLLVDEAYGDFATANCMALATARENANILVMRTFSKSYSLAGLRVGYCVGPVDLIAALYKIKDSYNVDAVAQAVALAAVRDQAWMTANAEKIIKTREVLAKALVARGWDVLPSQSNFLFARPAKLPAKALFEALRERNVFVRYFPGPKTGDRLRITVGTDRQTKTLLKALDELDIRS